MVYNFNPGPATLPAEVMQQAQAEFCNYKGLGYGIMEASHRAKDYEEINDAAEANLKELLGLDDNYSVLFLQGGASLQFAMVPMNLLPEGGVADYADTGAWSNKAIKEAKPFGKVNVIADCQNNYTFIPDVAKWQYTPGAAYCHITSNNTIFGTQYQRFPTPPAGLPLVADMSSDILSRVIDGKRFAVIYAGAQKNLGPSGVTVVAIRKDLAAKPARSIPTMLRYSTHLGEKSLYNTPPTFSVYMVRLVTDWIKKLGGVAALQQRNEAKAQALYAEIDRDGFYRCPVNKADRSRMNVVFRLPSEELEETFLKGTKAKGMIGLKGHRSAGGVRASIYNAMPAEGVATLTTYMAEFRQKNG